MSFINNGIDFGSYNFSNTFQNEVNNKKPIQKFVENFSGHTEIYEESTSHNEISEGLNTFLSQGIRDMQIFMEEKSFSDAITEFNLKENQLDGMELCNYGISEEFSTIDYSTISSDSTGFMQSLTCDLQISPPSIEYLNLDDFMKINSGEIFENDLLSKEKCKEIPKKENDIGKVGRGRPKTNISKLEAKVKESLEKNDKRQIRIDKNNKASKIYREKRSEKQKRLDEELKEESKINRKLYKIHKKLQKEINFYELLLKSHTM